VTTFELFIARRYLRAHRKEKVISVITAISIAGVAVGVMALVIALAVNNGFKSTLERDLLGAMADVTVAPKESAYGIEDWEKVAAQVARVPRVTAAAPALYDQVMISGPIQNHFANLKGVSINDQLKVTQALDNLKAGSVDRLRDPHANPPGIILGSRLADDTGMMLGATVQVLTPRGNLTPYGALPEFHKFRVVGIFETGFYEFDDNFAYCSLPAAQKIFSLPDVINQLELDVDDVNRAGAIAKDVEKAAGPRYTTTTWMESNQQILKALNMERVVIAMTIGLIELVAALNIFITLVMMVMEKYRDIAVLMSMGARRQQIRRIFMLQGVLIGIVGSAIGLGAGYALSYYANRYHWIRLDETVYPLSYVPFDPKWIDDIWVPAAAILVSFLATVYPARKATHIAPAEVLRYE
jgi:lipoprotein-releasing system permease protein